MPDTRRDHPPAGVTVHVNAERWFPAPPRVTYDLFVERLWRDGAHVPPRPVIEEAGAPDGLGCTRRIGTPEWGVRERITATRAPERLTYRVLPGSRLFAAEGHEGVVEFFERPGGTLVRWRIEFRPRRRGLRSLARTTVAWYLFVLGRAVRQKRHS